MIDSDHEVTRPVSVGSAGPSRAPPASRARRAASRTSPAPPAPPPASARASASSNSSALERARGRRADRRPARRAPRRRSSRARPPCPAARGGTPAASASSGVRPSPSYSDRNANARASRVQRRQLLVGDVLVPAHLRPSSCSAAIVRRRSSRGIAAVVADDVERGVRMRARDRRKRANQIGDVAAVEDGADEQHSVGTRDWGLGTRRAHRVASPERPAPSPDARRDHVDLVRRHVEPFDELALRELRDRDHRRRAAGGLARQPAPAHAFAEAEPLRVRDERQIVDGDDGRHREPKRRGVGGREPDVEMIAGHGARQLHLLPPASRRRRRRCASRKRRASSDSASGPGA